jgi:hypothetical protein
VAAPALPWAAGTRILRDHFASRGGSVVELDMPALASVNDALLEGPATALLLLVGYPEPAVSIVESIRRDPPSPRS